MARRPFTLYWSSMTTFEGCPLAFLWSRGWGDIDVGGGPGRRKPIPEPRSRHHAIMGIAIQAGIEEMYNQEWWRDPKTMPQKMLDEAQRCFNRELMSSYVDWHRSPPRSELEATVLSGVRGYVRTMKQHRLLGGYARAEVELRGYIDQHHGIAGRADTVFKRQDTGVTILDGKNSKRFLDKKTGQWFTYTDPDQLRWYALCYYLMYGKYPDRLGFVYYRYPYGYIGEEGYEDTPAEGVVWVDFTPEDLKGIAARAVKARKAMDAEQFDANPSPQGCRFCDFEPVCEARQEQKKKNRRGRRRKNTGLTPETGIGDLTL